MQVPVLSARGILIGSNRFVFVFLGVRSKLVDITGVVVLDKETCGIVTCGMNN